MTIDIILVSYNSKNYIKGCIDSILKSNYDLNKVGIYVYDNNSTDDSIEIFNEYKKKHLNTFRAFEIIEGKSNIGFGRANNEAVKKSTAEYVFLLNIDCEINIDTLSKIEEEINKNKGNKIGIYELKQEPYEHPKYYDPITKETKWASGACMILPRKIFKKVKGFDKNIFMYCEDVELSFHVRKLGYKILYLNDIPITHYSYKSPNEFKRSQFVNTVPNNMYLRFKYANLKNIIKGYFLCLFFLRNEINNNKIENIEEIKKEVNKNFTKMFFKGIGAYIFRIKNIFNNNKIDFYFNGFEYSGVRDGAFYVKKDIKRNPLVSILVRTCGRPDVLRETIISLKNQTYKNLEIVVVEDGKNCSEKNVEK